MHFLVMWCRLPGRCLHALRMRHPSRHWSRLHRGSQQSRGIPQAAVPLPFHAWCFIASSAELRLLQGWVVVFQVENRCPFLLEGSWLSFFKGGRLLQRCTERLKIEHTLEHSKWHTSDKGALIRGNGSSTLKRRRRTHAERKYNNTCWVNKHTRQDIRIDWVSFSFKMVQSPVHLWTKGAKWKCGAARRRSWGLWDVAFQNWPWQCAGALGGQLDFQQVPFSYLSHHPITTGSIWERHSPSRSELRAFLTKASPNEWVL